MARFYVVRGRKALWNLFIMVLVIAALVYIFRVEGDAPEAEVTAEPSKEVEQVVVVEPVTVRTVPTKFAEYKLERSACAAGRLSCCRTLPTTCRPRGAGRSPTSAAGAH